MAFTSAYNATEKIYTEHLESVKGTKFTPREIDIIACILHSRGDKKIASLFLLSPRTVGAHIYNIMNKIGCNAKDQIIDFVETSGKLGVLREYYLHVLLKAHFEKLLTKIGAIINRNKIYVSCTREDVLEITNNLYQSVQKHFAMANIECVEAQSAAYEGVKEKIVCQINLQQINANDYYETLIAFIKTAIHSSELEQLIIEFHETCKELVELQSGVREATAKSETNINKFYKLRWILLTSLVILISGTIFYNRFNNSSNYSPPEIIKDLELFLTETQSAAFTANNVDKTKASANQNLIKKIERILDYKNTKIVDNYFTKSEMDSKFLVKYVFNLHSLASYYMFNKHNGQEAKLILLYAKKLIEEYVNMRSTVKSEFDKLSPEEIYTELAIVQELPEIYTRIVYSLGRAYIYDGPAKEGKKYFELAKYLGHKMLLLEGYLSDISGLLIIKKDEALEDNKKERTAAILDVINEYKSLKEDKTAYIADYNPALTTQEKKIPALESYNIFFCTLKQLEAYRDLIVLTQDHKLIKGYIEKINLLLGDDGSSSSDSSIFALKEKIILRKLAGLYNCLGEIFVILSKKNYNEIILPSSIIQALDLKISDNTIKYDDPKLLVAESCFEKARAISRNTDFTKADAYNNLVMLYQLALEQDATLHLNVTLQESLKKAIEDCILKRDEINKALNRKQLNIISS